MDKLNKNVAIAVKLPAMIIVCCLALATTLGITNYFQASSALELSVENALSAIAAGRKKALNDYLASIEQDLRATAASPFVAAALTDFTNAWQEYPGNQERSLQNLYIEANPHPTGEKHRLDAARDGSAYSAQHGRYHPWFRTFLEERSYYDIFLFDTRGNVIYSVFKELDFATNVRNGRWKDSDLGTIFRNAIALTEAGAVAFADFKPYAPSANAPASFIATPIFSEAGRKIGVLAFQMPIGRLNEVMKVRDGMGESGEAYLVGSDLLMRTDSRFAKESTILKQEVDTESVRAALEGEAGVVVTTDYRGVEIVSAYQPIDFEGVRWALLAEKDEAEAFAGVTSMRNTMIGLVVLLIALAGATGYGLSLLIVRPISSMTTAMKGLADGELETEVPGLDRQDEIGSMASAVEVFKQNGIERAKLEEAQATAQREKEARTQAVDELIAGFDRSMEEALQVVTSTANEMEASAKSLNETAEQAAHQSSAVAAASNQAASNVQTVAAATEEMSSSIKEISRQVTESGDIANAAVEEARQASDRVKNLVEASQRIGEVVDLITDVAAQTNLLALNATIEAARAGEAGKGFAVVASEVKSLATQTAKATDEIAQQIGTIQAETSNAVSVIEGITTTISKFDEITTSISAAVEEQGTATSEISRNVQEAARGTEDVNQNIAKVSEGAAETGGGATQAFQAARELSQQAVHVREQVSSFLEKVKTA